MKGDDFITPVISVIFILLIVFLLICLECILRNQISYIVSDLNAEQDVIECKIRKIIFMNPKSEIIVLCTPKNPETLTVLTRLQNEFSQLHIIK